MVSDLNNFKEIKKTKLIHKELLEAKKRLTASIELLKDYGKYIPIMESLSVLHNSRTIIEININKYERIINDKLE